jgi:type IV secretion system protein VirB9
MAEALISKPVVASKTNMTILTNINSYSFQLDSRDPMVSPTYKLQFIYPVSGYSADGISNAVAVFDPDKLNWKYSFTGDKLLVPVKVFDNGQFTYFQFKKDGMSRVPAIFIADKNRNESLVNYHMQGDYLIVNTLAKQFTLRDGAYVTSIYNDAAIGDWKKVV